LRHCPTSWKVVGSIPDGVIGTFIEIILQAAQWSWGLREMSIKIISWGVRRRVCRADSFTVFNVLKARSLKLLDPSGLVQVCTGIATLSVINIKHTSEKSYSKSTQNIIGNWKHSPTLYFTLYWTLGSQDD